MSSSKSNIKNRDTTLLKEVKKVRDEIENLNAKVSRELESLRDYTRKENKNLLSRDLGIITLTFGGIFMALSFSFLQLGLGKLFWNTFGAGSLLVFSGLVFFILSFGPFKKLSRESLRDAIYTAKKYPYETLLALVGLALAILAVITLII